MGIKSMFHNEDADIAAAHGIENDLTVNDGETVVIFHSQPNLNGSRSKLRYSVGRVYKAKWGGCRIWAASSRHKTIETAIAAAKKLV
ncbi:MAG: hypothetical protein ACPHSD_19640 [Candidatus Latescibacterota bacterium]|jgi:hypothetical protein